MLHGLRKYLLFFAVISISSPLLEAEARDNNFYNIHQHYMGVRPMAMGNAFTAVGGDYNTIFYNPAGLYDIEKPNIIIDLARYGASYGDNSLASFYNEIRGASNKAGTDRTTELARLVSSKYGKEYYARFSPLSTFYVKPRMGIAFIPIDGTFNISIDNQVGPTIKLQANQDATLAFGYAFGMDFGEQQLRIGATAKGMYRAFARKVIPTLDFERNKDIIKSDMFKEGIGVDMDLGFLHHMPIFWGIKMSSGLTIRNFFDFGFKENTLKFFNKGSSNPPDIQRRFDVGANFAFQKLWIFQPNFSVDIRDLGHENFSLIKGAHAGTEWKVDLGKHFDGRLMMGFNQGYLTYGAALQGLWYLVEFATFGEEMGTKSGGKRKSQVRMAKLSLYF